MQASAVAAWSDILCDISRAIGETRYNLWFRNTVAVSCEQSSLKVGVPSTFMAEWIETHYRDVLLEVASKRLGRSVDIAFVVEPTLFRNKRRREAAAKSELLDEAAPRQPAGLDIGRCSLDNFVVGPCNSVAYAAACKVAGNPATAYNPLFIHGGVGLGKTHLLLGIAGAIRGPRQRRGIEYVSAEAFTNRFLFALRNGTLDAFRQRYRTTKLLIIDDVHFLANKPATQEEFLNTYNTLSREGCQVVMASDSHPKLISKLKESLVTRFLSGMVVRLEKPGYDMRLQLVRHKAEQRHISLPPAVAEFVAGNVTGSVRELEGAVNTLAAYASLSGGSITTSIAREALKGLVKSHCRPVRLPEIDAAVTAYAALREGDLRSKRRTRPLARARHVAMY
ncbi:MAG: chromosomal replication initiator protein DnaA, partial [Planctomycetes bacterium]|nr:chromosomal replication initiator protein DnaA [Planctomycetota bacterium]